MKAREEWSVYLVRCADASLYTGVAKDAVARVTAHNSGKGAAYTRSRLPVKLVYLKKGFTRSSALVEEARIKSLERTDKLALLKKAGKALRRTAAALLLAAAALAPARALPVFDKENAVVMSSVSAQAFTGEATYAPLRMYYLPAISSGAPHASSGAVVMSATSVDGLAFTLEAGVRLGTATIAGVSASSITGFSLQPLGGGGFRALYSIVSTTGAFRIHSATSADGLAFGGNAVAVDGVTTFVGSPRLVVLTSGDWRLFYTRDFDGGNDLADRRVYTARSTDEGATWGASSLVISTTAYEVGASKLTDGKVRLYYTQPPSAPSSATVVVSALSSDALGTSFSSETGLRLSTAATVGGIAFPVPARSTDSFRWRLYYTFFLVNSSTGDARSALTGSPAPASITPSLVFSNSAASPFTIKGEVFSAAPTVALSRGATNIAGTAVTRTDDQTITATFDTQNKPLAAYDLIVTNNPDPATGTLANAVTIDFAPGSVVLTNNLLRPRDGTPTTIEAITFNPGHITIRVLDSEGREVRTIFEGNRDAGTLTTTWDGKNSSGASVASGVYMVVTTGPKIKSKNKIVVIR